MTEKIQIPNMLLAGSTGRNSGKTYFCCSLIRKFTLKETIIAVKITTVREEGCSCIRENRVHCGACTSFSGNFSLLEETNREGGKDTQLMLEAGAYKVYWLRAREKYLAEGIKNLMENIKGNELIICESNSIGAIVKPGLFLMFHDKYAKVIKESAEKVMPDADRLVIKDNNSFNLNMEAVRIINGEWILEDDASYVD